MNPTLLRLAGFLLSILLIGAIIIVLRLELMPWPVCAAAVGVLVACGVLALFAWRRS